MDGLVIAGGAGRLARAIKRVCPTARLAPRQNLDITDAASIARALDRLAPTVVINTAALPDVDRCEREPDLAMAVNAQGAGALARRCAQLGVPLIHISTDYVFWADAPRAPFLETDAPCPSSQYGRSKALGERLVLEASPTARVARVSWLFGHEGDFLNEMLRKAAAGGPLTVFRQTGSPTPIVDAAGRLVTLAAALRDGACAPPILHVAGGPPASRRAWVTPALQAYQAARRETASEILEVDPPANRPLFSALDTTLSTEFFGSNLDWRSAAARAGIAAAG